MASITEPGEKSLPPPHPDDKKTTNEKEKEGTETDNAAPPDGDLISEMAKKPKGLPPIDLGELNSLLRNPNMPQKKILHEVADKVIQSRNDRSKNKDGCEMITGMKGLFDCILEVSLKHTESDDEEDEGGIPLKREFECLYCQKVFTSSMAMKTHILVLHSNQDSSVLNLRQLMASEGQRITPAHRTKPRDSSDTKSRHPSRGEKTSPKVRDENIPVGRSSMSRSQPKVPAKSEEKSSQDSMSQDSGEGKAKSSSLTTNTLKSDIHSEKIDSVVASNPTSPSDEPSKDVSRVSPSSQGDDKHEIEDESKQTISGVRKRHVDEEGEEGATPSRVKRGRSSRGSQGEAQDTKPTPRRSSRRH